MWGIGSSAAIAVIGAVFIALVMFGFWRALSKN
jgi:hypothetical protein